jgi:hypothetical protein
MRQPHAEAEAASKPCASRVAQSASRARLSRSGRLSDLDGEFALRVGRAECVQSLGRVFEPAGLLDGHLQLTRLEQLPEAFEISSRRLSHDI